MEPTLNQLKAHLRVDSNAEDTLIQSYLATAVDTVQQMTGYRLAPQVVDWYYDVPLGGVLLTAPITSVVVSTRNADGTYTNVPAEDVTLLIGKNGTGTVYLDTTQTPAESHPMAWRLRLSVGEATLPKALYHALLLLVGHYYRNREAVDTERLADIPLGIQTLLNPYKVGWFG